VSSLFQFGITEAIVTAPAGVSNVLSNFNVAPVDGLVSGALITLTATGVTDGDIFFAFVADGATPPDGAQIIAGTDGDDNPALWTEQVEIASIDTWAQGPTTLIQNTPYDCYAVYRATNGNLSDVQFDSFSTPDLAPALANGVAYSYGSTTAILSIDTDDPTGTLYGILSASSTEPTAAQIRAGQNNTGTAAEGFSSRAMTSIGKKALWLSGLPAGATLYPYWTQRDENNLDTVFSGSPITLDATETVVFSAATDGTLGTITNISAGITKTEFAADPFGGTDAVTITDPPSGTACFLQSPDQTFSFATNKYRCLIKKGAWAGSNAYLRTRIVNTVPAFANYVNLNTKAWSGTEYANEVIRQIDDDWIMAYAEFSPATDNSGRLDYRFTDNASNNSMSSGCAANHTVSFHKIKVSY
jgi:hypothetical protein